MFWTIPLPMASGNGPSFPAPPPDSLHEKLPASNKLAHQERGLTSFLHTGRLFLCFNLETFNNASLPLRLQNFAVQSAYFVDLTLNRKAWCDMWEGGFQRG